MLSFLRRLSFATPGKGDVLIFDAAGSWVLTRFILDGIPHVVLPARFETIYVAPKVLMRMIANVYRLRVDDMPHGWFFNLRMLAFQLRHLYFLACLDSIAPKVVLTFVDTHIYFQRCAQTFRGATFIAVQNGVRDRNGITPPNIPAPPHPAARIRMPHLYCFGRYEADLYAANGHVIDNFHPAGSVRASVYLAGRGPLPPAKTHDVCVISQWRFGIADVLHNAPMPRSGQMVQVAGFAVVVDFIARYASERSVSVSVARSSEHPEEYAYLRQRLGEKATIVNSRREDLRSYACVDAADVVVTGNSTLGVEALGWGKKTLFCNFTGDDGHGLPKEGLWSLSEPDYATFRDRLDAIRAMTDAAYRRVAGEFARYMMQLDSRRPAHLAVRDHVLAGLKGCGETWCPPPLGDDGDSVDRARTAG